MTNTINRDSIVLVVDDSPESLGMLNIALGEAGFTALVALSGMQALSIIEKIEPDIVLLDAVMPEIDGFVTCKKLKLRLPNTPVIFMTGLTDLEHIVAGFDAGGVDYVTKPIKPDEVIARIKVHITNAKMTSSARAALDTTGQHIFSVDNAGNILWATQQAKKLFNDISSTGQIKHTFTNELANWLNHAEDRHDLIFMEFSEPIKVTYIGKQDVFEHLIKISLQTHEYNADQLLEKLPITNREAEVLLWLSLGKTNWEIAQILKISPRTVNKHLEQIFRKIEVDNRTTAAAVAFRILNNT